MKRMSRAKRIGASALLGAGLLASTGCDEQMASQWAALSSDYVGSVVSALVARGLQDALGIEATEDQTGSTALHEHEH